MFEEKINPFQVFPAEITSPKQANRETENTLEKQKKERLMDFLINNKLLFRQDGILVSDMKRIHSPEVSRALHLLYLGRENDKNIMGSYRLISEFFSDIEAVPLEDYEHKRLTGEPYEYKKVLLMENLNAEEIARKKLLIIFEEGGYLENKNGLLIMDLEKIQEDDLLTKIRDVYLARKGRHNSIKANRRNIFELFQDMKVVSREDYEKATNKKDVQTKPLFNVPASREEAFDVATVKNNSNYYLNFWDLYKNIKGGFNLGEYPLKAGNGDDINLRDFYITTRLYKDFKGKRDEDGRLMVYDSNEGYRKISAGWLRKNLGTFGPIFAARGIHNFLLEKGGDLIKENIITQKDFESQTTGSGSDKVRKEFILGVNKPQVMINNIVYYFGRENFVYDKKRIPMENLRIVVLDKDTAGIIEVLNGREKLSYTFKLLDKNEREQKEVLVRARAKRELSKKEIASRCYVNKKELDRKINPWKITSDNPKRSDETPEEYAERIATLADYKFISKVTDNFIKHSQVPIYKKLSWREQQWLASAVYHFGIKNREKELFDFGRKYGAKGLKTFLSLEFGREMGEKILAIGEKFDQETADAIFAKYAELADAAQEAGEYLASQFGNNDPRYAQEVAEHLLRRGKMLLKLCADEDFSPEKISTKLEDVRGEIEIFSAILRSAKNNGIKINMEDVKNLKIEKKLLKNGNELSQEEKEELTRILKANYKDIFSHNPEAYERVVRDFEDEINSSDDQIVYIMKHRNEIMAFCRFVPISSTEVYGGSLNVVNEIQNLSIGNYFIKAALDEISERYDIRIKTRKNNPANDAYKKMDFKTTGEHRENDGTEYYDMLRPSKNQLKKAA